MVADHEYKDRENVRATKRASAWLKRRLHRIKPPQSQSQSQSQAASSQTQPSSLSTTSDTTADMKVDTPTPASLLDPDLDPATTSPTQFTPLWLQALVERKKSLPGEADADGSLHDDFTSDGVDALIKETKTLVEAAIQQSDPTWGIAIAGHGTTVSANPQRLRDLAAPILGCLRSFERVADVAAGIDPLHFGPVWVVVKFFLTAGRAVGDAKDNAVALLALIGPLVNKCVLNEHLYLTAISDPSTTGPAQMPGFPVLPVVPVVPILLEQLRNMIKDIYSQVVEVLMGLTEYLQAGGFHKVTKAMLYPQEHGDRIGRLSQLDHEMTNLVQSLFQEKTLSSLRDTRIQTHDLLMKLKEPPAVEERSTSRKPIFFVPFLRDPDFVDRPAVWEWVTRKFTGPDSRIGLVGMGGFGKSQMAIQLAYHVRKDSPSTNIFWVHGSTKASFEESYRSLADAVELPRRHDLGVNVLALVRDWLRTEDAKPWLMIIDNADEVGTFFTKDEGENNAHEPMASYLPQTDSGKILVTSRSLDVAEKLTGSHKAIFTIPTMDRSEALQLFRTKIDENIDHAGADDLVESLYFIPLAINQAAAYINRRSPQVTVRSYLDDFRTSQKRKESLLNHDAGDLRRHEGVSNSVMVTWQVTFEQVRRERPKAASLLSLMSLFHSQNIPKYMLLGYNLITFSVERLGAQDDDGPEDGDLVHHGLEDDDPGDDLDFLGGYSLIGTTAAQGLFEMHPLMQFCMRAWLSRSGELVFFQRLFLALACYYFPDGSFESWERCQALLPHIWPLLDEEPLGEDCLVMWSDLLTNVAVYMRNMGRCSEAEVLLERVVTAGKRVFKEDHPHVLASIGRLAMMRSDQWRLKETEEALVRVLDLRKRKLGEEHPETLASIGNLALVFSDQRRWKEAEELEVQVMETSKRVFGEEHIDTLRSMGNLAALFASQGQFGEAEELEVQVMEARKRTLGEEHPDTLVSIGNLAQTFKNQERLDKAEEFGLQEMETSKRVLGEEHPGTLKSMAFQPAVWHDLGRVDDAVGLLEDCVRLRGRVLGEDHPETLGAVSTLGKWRERSKGPLVPDETLLFP